MIDRYLLRYFLAVVEKGNFSRAAEHCGVSQPTLSVGIARLEAELKRQLFERTNRRVSLTEAGNRFAVHARRIEAEFADAARSVLEPAARAVLRVGVLGSLPAAWLAAALDRWAPESGVEMMEGRRSELVSLLDRGRVDAILTIVADGTPAEATVATERYLLALPERHALAGCEQVDVRDLAGEAMVVRRHCEALPEVSAFFTGHGVRPRIAARTTSDERALAFVRCGFGVTVMPACFASPGVTLAPLAGFSRSRAIGFDVSHDNRWMLAAGAPLARLRDALRESVVPSVATTPVSPP